MQDFIEATARRLDADEATIESVTGSLLLLLRERADAGAVENLLSQLPGASQLAESGATGGAGVLGGLGAMLGGSPGALAALAGSGLSRDEIRQIAEEFHEYARARVAPELVDQVLSSVPELENFRSQ